MRATAIGNINVVKKLVTAGADFHYKNVDGLSPLHTAAMIGNNELINYFISKGIDINIETNDGETPLMTAVWMGHVDTVKLLIQKGANVKCKKITPCNPAGEYPLEWAGVKYRDTNDSRYMEIGQLLYDAGATIPEKYQ